MSEALPAWKPKGESLTDPTQQDTERLVEIFSGAFDSMLPQAIQETVPKIVEHPESAVIVVRDPEGVVASAVVANMMYSIVRRRGRLCD